MQPDQTAVLIRRLIKQGKYDFDALKDAFTLCRLSGNHGQSHSIRKILSGHIKAGTPGASGLFREALKFDGRLDFDCFMRYIEIDRPPEQQFWLPRRKKLLPVCRAMQRLEDGRLDELFLSMPPRTGKTTLTLFFLLWSMLRNPEHSNLFCSYTESVVRVFYRGLLEILEDPMTYRWRDLFPEAAVSLTDAKELQINIGRRKRYPSFTGRSLYGTLNGACDCSGYTVSDDLLSGIEEAMNPARLDTAWAHVENNLLPRGKEQSRRLWIGTRWSVSDCQARRLALLQSEPGFAKLRWRAINVPALNDRDRSNFAYACGAGFSTAYYRQRRASYQKNGDMASWLAQYQGEPVERDGLLFAPSQMRYYNGVLPPCSPDYVFMAVDPAWGGGDYTAAPVCFRCGDDLYIHDAVFDNGDKRITQPLIVQTAIKHGVSSILIEASRSTASYAEEVQKLLRERGASVTVRCSLSHFTGTGKRQRIFDKAPEIREHMIFLTETVRSPAYEAFMRNVFSFTAAGQPARHDDAPDSLAMAIHAAFGGTRQAEVFPRPL